MTDEPQIEDTPLPPASAPENIPFSIRGVSDTETAHRLSQVVANYVRAISRYIDLSNLDGITLAGDYEQALLELDRGYETTHKLTPTKEGATGVAMTPSVIRDGSLKSHIVLKLGLAVALEDQANDANGLAFQTIAHECAHVEVTQRFDQAFPNTLLRSQRPNFHVHLRWDIILACWDEYAASRISAPFGENPTRAYTETFVSFVLGTRQEANGCIKAYRRHGDHNQILIEVHKAYGNLMKYACYLLGTMASFGLSQDDLPEVKAALDGHWFAPYFEKLRLVCQEIWSEYGQWQSEHKFEVIGDIADDIVREGGMFVTVSADGQVNFRVPFTEATMPDTLQ